VGTRPSVDERPEITVETMLLDFDREIYGEELITEYPLYLRDIQKFDGIEAVWKQVQKDIKVTKEKLMRGVET
jgi:riboflavin kinase/FMN adenylyltransferase